MFLLVLGRRITELCHVGEIDFEFAELALLRGEAARPGEFEDPEAVQAEFEVDHLGLKLPTLISNVHDLVMIEEGAAGELRELLGLEPIEQFRFTLLNHKGRAVKPQYVLLNPLGTHEVAHPSSSFLRFDTSGNVYDCDRWILDRRKLEAIRDLPDIIRPRCLPHVYFVSPRFVDLVNERGYTNFNFVPVDTA